MLLFFTYTLFIILMLKPIVKSFLLIKKREDVLFDLLSICILIVGFQIAYFYYQNAFLCFITTLVCSVFIAHLFFLIKKDIKDDALFLLPFFYLQLFLVGYFFFIVLI